MQSLQQQQQLLSNQDSPQFDFADCNHQSVSDFLNHSHLNQYLDIFLSEGFDSVTSLLEITEDDMIFMNVKRGHRRLIQREIATVKGVPRDQPLVTNMMGTKYSSDMMSTIIKMYTSRRPISNSNNNNNSSGVYGNSGITNMNSGSAMSGYDTLPTGLTSPRSMHNGIGSSTSSSSRNSSSSSPITTLRSRLQQHNPKINNMRSSASSSTNDSGSGKTNQNNNDATMSDTNRSSSNDDDDSIDTNESVPTKRKYRRHAKPDRHAPIKPPSAYIMFSNDSRAELKNQNLSFAKLAKIVGDQWKNLSHTEKQVYERMAMRAKDEYLAALEQYRQTPQYNRYQEYLNDFKSKQDAANRLIGRARKRAKQKSPGSGSVADSSSNGNSNGNGSSGSGSADDYGDKENVIRRQRRPSDQDSTQKQPSSLQQQKSYNYAMEDVSSTPTPNQLRPIYHHNHSQQQQSSDSGYTSQTYYNSNVDKQQSSPVQQQPQWSYRSNQIMRGMLPIEFVHTTQPEQQLPAPKKQSLDVGDKEDEAEDERSTSYDNTKRRSPRFNKSSSNNNTMPNTMQT